MVNILIPWPYSPRQGILNEAKIGFFTQQEIGISKKSKFQRFKQAISPLPWTNVTQEGPIKSTKVLKSIFHLFLLKAQSSLSSLPIKFCPTLFVGIPDVKGENRIPMPIAIKRLQNRTIVYIQICIEWCSVYTCCGLPPVDTWVLYKLYVRDRASLMQSRNDIHTH